MNPDFVTLGYSHENNKKPFHHSISVRMSSDKVTREGAFASG